MHLIGKACLWIRAWNHSFESWPLRTICFGFACRALLLGFFILVYVICIFSPPPPLEAIFGATEWFWGEGLKFHSSFGFWHFGSWDLILLLSPLCSFGPLGPWPIQNASYTHVFCPHPSSCNPNQKHLHWVWSEWACTLFSISIIVWASYPLPPSFFLFLLYYFFYHFFYYNLIILNIMFLHEYLGK